jgi:hypothetical protein
VNVYLNSEGIKGYNDLKQYLTKLVKQNKAIFVGGDFNEKKYDVIEFLVNGIGFFQLNYDPTYFQKSTGRKFLNDICFGFNIDVKLVQQVKNNW